ncbi:MAG: hypothetical protein H0T79_04360, partial [Deltaproteobacteria bacterium]|nr:hypothetical protein [Deltaproteobacteria bacterium]
AGNVGTATATFTIDTGAPGVTIVASPPNPTSDNTATVTFTTFGMPSTVECQIDSGAFVACTSPFTTSPLADASHTITVRASDNAGNAGTAFRTFVVDTTSPTVTITVPPATPFNDSTPSATFTVSGGAILTQCQIDAGAFATCSSPFTASMLADGAHSLQIHATDAAGNLGTATAAFVIDTVAPTVTITAAPSSLTNDATPSVSFTFAGAPSSVQCRVDAGTFTTCTSPFTSPALADGTHTITVRVTDAATNTASAAVTFDLDATAPVITITSAPPAQTNDSTPSVAFTIGGAPVLIECQVDSGGFAACTSPFTAPTLADGAHTIAIRATDMATNVSTVPVSFTVDTVAPTVTITGQPAAQTNDNTATITFTTAGAPSTTQCQIDSGAFATCTSPFTTTALIDGLHTVTVRVTDLATNASTDTASFTVDVVAPTAAFTATPSNPTNDNTPSIGFTTAGAPTLVECQLDTAAFVACSSPYLPGTLADGAHTIRVRVTDGAANTSTISTTFVVDTQDPTVVFVTQPATQTSDTTPTVTFTVGGAPTTTQCKVDTGAFASCSAGTFTAAALADGVHSITVRVTDAAANFAEIVATFTVDTAPPTVMLTAQPANPTNDTTPAITFSTTADVTATTCQIDAGTFAACTSSFTASTLAQGNHSLTVRVVDAAGNAATATTGTFVIDTTAPTVTITAPGTPTGDSTPDVVFTAPGATSFTCQVDAAAPVACVSPFTTPILTDAAHTVIVRATDAATNTGMASTTFTVDTTPPSITITTPPPDPTNDATPTLAFMIVNGPATTQCQIDAGTFASCTSPFTPAVALSNAQHTITIRATDTAGNQGTDAATFTVDTVPPVVAITTAPPAQTNDTTPSISFTITGGTATCQIDTGTAVACTPPTFTAPSPLSQGLHSYTIVGSDTAGNTDTEIRSFTVDTTAPVVTLTSAPPAQTSDTTPSVAFTVTGATTIQCQIDTGVLVTCTSPYTAPLLADGDHTITVHGTDLANNSGSDTAVFTVDTLAPTIALTGGPTGGYPTGDATQTFTFSTTGATGTQCRVAPAVAFSTCTS